MLFFFFLPFLNIGCLSFIIDSDQRNSSKPSKYDQNELRLESIYKRGWRKIYNDNFFYFIRFLEPHITPFFFLLIRLFSPGCVGVVFIYECSQSTKGDLKGTLGSFALGRGGIKLAGKEEAIELEGLICFIDIWEFDLSSIVVLWGLTNDG